MVKDIETRMDFFNNHIHTFSLHTTHNHLKVIATTEIEVYPRDTQLHMLSNCSVFDSIERFKNDHQLRQELLDFMLPSTYVYWDEEVIDFAKSGLDMSDTLMGYVQTLCGQIFNTFTYDPEFTTIQTPVKTVLKEKKGVCQDFSHLAIACFRSLGLAARYVSGYLETLPPPGKPKLQGSDASHAWVSVYIPDFGWYDFDPTNNFSPSERHITIAWGRDYEDVPPIKGVVLGYGTQDIKVEVDVLAIENE
jgi:transglutaminase-like putative cysteine protease